jgi:glycosyltransferase involved in cell wall biosynthesis
MKVVFFTGHTSRKFGGLEEFLLQMNRELGDKLLVVENDVHEVPGEVTERFRSEGLNLSNRTVSRRILPTVREIVGVLRQTKPSAVHVNFAPVSYITIVLARLLGIKNIFWTKHSMLWIKKYSKTWWYHRICQSFVKNIICVSQAIEEELDSLDLGNGKRIVLPLGVNIDKYHSDDVNEDLRRRYRDELRIEPDDVVMAAVAQIRPVKRLDVLIDAVNVLVNEFGLKNLKAFIIGGTFVDGESRELEANYRRKIDECGLSVHVRLLGIRNDVHLIYAVSHMSGLTSASEGLPLALVEAAASSLPLFGSNTGGIPEVVQDGHNGILFEPGDYRELAVRLKELIEDKELMKRYGENSKQVADQHYNVATNVKKLIGLYLDG